MNSMDVRPSPWPWHLGPGLTVLQGQGRHLTIAQLSRIFTEWTHNAPKPCPHVGLYAGILGFPALQ